MQQGFSELLIRLKIARKMREIKPNPPKLGERQKKEKPRKRSVFKAFMAEGKGFEPLWAGAQTVFKTASL